MATVDHANPAARAAVVIPKRFQLAGLVWKVREVAGLAEMGKTDSMNAEIILNAGMPQHVKEATFFHELVHAIKYTLGEDTHDEKEVEQIGGLIHQFLKSRKP